MNMREPFQIVSVGGHDDPDHHVPKKHNHQKQPHDWSNGPHSFTRRTGFLFFHLCWTWSGNHISAIEKRFAWYLYIACNFLPRTFIWFFNFLGNEKIYKFCPMKNINLAKSSVNSRVNRIEKRQYLLFIYKDSWFESWGNKTVAFLWGSSRGNNIFAK